MMQAMETPPNSEVSVLLCSDDEIQELNRDYRHQDKPTDVLAFALEHDANLDSAAAITYDSDTPQILGDIVISVDTAKRQADANGVSLMAETTMLLAHGLLHLLGFDHAEPDEAKVMFARQADLIAAATPSN